MWVLLQNLPGETEGKKTQAGLFLGQVVDP